MFMKTTGNLKCVYDELMNGWVPPELPERFSSSIEIRNYEQRFSKSLEDNLKGLIGKIILEEDSECPYIIVKVGELFVFAESNLCDSISSRGIGGHWFNKYNIIDGESLKKEDIMKLNKIREEYI